MQSDGRLCPRERAGERVAWIAGGADLHHAPYRRASYRPPMAFIAFIHEPPFPLEPQRRPVMARGGGGEEAEHVLSRVWARIRREARGKGGNREGRLTRCSR